MDRFMVGVSVGRGGMKAALLGVVVGCTAGVWAETYTGSGLQTVDSAAWFGSYDALVFKPGTFSYTGGDATFSGPLTLDGKDAAHKVVTFNVENPNTTVTFVGKANGAGAGFFKNGPGTIRYTYGGPDETTLADTTSGVASPWAARAFWDVTGVLTQAALSAYTVWEGKSIFDGGANQNLHFGGVYIGSRDASYDSTLEINGGLAKLGNVAWTRGSGTVQQPLSSSLIARDATLIFNGMMFAYGNGTQDYLGDARFFADNCTVTNSGSIYFGESRSRLHILLTNGTHFVHSHDYDLRTFVSGSTGGFEIPRGEDTVKSGNVTSIVDVVDHASFQAYGLAVCPYGWLNVTDGSAFRFDRSIYYTTVGAKPPAQGGNVFMDDATLAPARPFFMSDWFTGLGNETFKIGAKGMFVQTPLYSWLDPIPVAAAEGAAIVKTGAGTLGVPRVRVPVTVKEGTLRLGTHVHTASNRIDGGSIALAAGTTLSVGTARALDGVSVTAAGNNTLQFRPHAAGDAVGWSVWNEAKIRPDGIIQLTDSTPASSTFHEQKKLFPFASNYVGAAWSPRTIDVTRNFKVAFNYFVPHKNTAMAYAFAFVLHNAPEGRAVSGGESTAAGYAAQGNLLGVRQSLGVYFGVHENKTMFGTNATWDDTSAKTFTRTNDAGVTGDVNASFDYPAYGEIAYDAAAHKVTIRYRTDPLDVQQFDTENSYIVDLRETVGADTAIFGFTASTDSGNPCQHSIMNVRVSDADAAIPKSVPAGGTFTAGGAFTAAEVFASPARPGYAMDALAFADGDTLTIHAKGSAAQPAYLAFDRYDGSGMLVKDGTGMLGLVSTNAAHLDLTLAGGALALRKEVLESVDGGTKGDWYFSTDENGYSTLGDGIKIGSTVWADRETAFLTRRIRATGKWRLSFRIVMPKNAATADAWGFTFHNSKDGVKALGYAYSDGGLNYIDNSFRVLFRNYAYDKNGTTNRVQWTGSGYNNSYTDAQRSVDPTPITFYQGTDTRVTATYDDVAQTLLLDFVQDGKQFTHTFTGINIKRMIGGVDDAWFGFGTGGGGSHNLPDILDIRLERLDDFAAAWDTARYLKRVTVTADEAPIYLLAETNTVFTLADDVVLNGADLRVVATDAPATLTAGTLTGLDGTVTVDGAILDLATVKPGPDAMLRILNGGRVKANNTTSTRFNTVYVDGVEQTDGFYTSATASWIAAGRVSTRHGQGTVFIFR